MKRPNNADRKSFTRYISALFVLILLLTVLCTSCASQELEELRRSYVELENEHMALESEYTAYKEQMQPYEGLSQAEAQAREIAAKQEIEAQRAAEEAAAAAAAAEAEAKEKMGYETGITYDQLARTPDNYEGELVKFQGEVLQVLEGDTEIDIRLAVNGYYDQVLYCGYEPSLVSSRVLEDDWITIYGTSLGLYSYESTLGGVITIPAVWVEKIDQ